jgi:hypothetical protein
MTNVEPVRTGEVVKVALQLKLTLMNECFLKALGDMSHLLIIADRLK